MDIVDAIILGIIQELTEFLPVSSSGHLEIGREILNISLLAILFVIIIVLGIIISWTSTYFATQNILNLNTEKFNF